jgi:hypothetical protein
MRIFLIASGGWIAASILVRAPRRGHLETSIKEILLRSSAQEQFLGRHLRFSFTLAALAVMALQPHAVTSRDADLGMDAEAGDRRTAAAEER